MSVWLETPRAYTHTHALPFHSVLRETGPGWTRTQGAGKSARGQAGGEAVADELLGADPPQLLLRGHGALEALVDGRRLLLLEALLLQLVAARLPVPDVPHIAALQAVGGSGDGASA